MKLINLPSFLVLYPRQSDLEKLGYELEVGYLQSEVFDFEENKLVYFNLPSLEVHGLGHELEAGYLQSEVFDFEENKLVYFTLEMTITKSSKAMSLFKRAPRLDGNAGHFYLCDGYSLAGISPRAWFNGRPEGTLHFFSYSCLRCFKSANMRFFKLRNFSLLPRALNLIEFRRSLSVFILILRRLTVLFNLAT
jgi:hypothetical protein